MELERAMSENRKRLPVADQIRKGLEEAIRHAKGEITLKTTVVEVPGPPPEIQPEELTKLRLDNRMSQDVFARVLNVPTRSVRSWEEGKGKTLASGTSADPGLPPEHRRRPRSGRHDRRPGTRRPAEAAASGSVEEGHAAPTDDLRAGRGSPARTRGCASVRIPGRPAARAAVGEGGAEDAVGPARVPLPAAR